MIDQKGPNNNNWKGGRSKNHYAYTKSYRQRYPEKEPARKVVYRALRNGKLAKPKYCQHPRCFETETFAHHVDYSRALLVEWYCRKHHSDLHNGKCDDINEGIETDAEQMNFFSGTV